MNEIIRDIQKIMDDNDITQAQLAKIMGLKPKSLSWVFYSSEKVGKDTVVKIIDALFDLANKKRMEATLIEEGINKILRKEITICSWLKARTRNGDGDGVSDVEGSCDTHSE